MSVVQSPPFMMELEESWRVLETPAMAEIAEALIEELNAFPRMVEVATHGTEEPDERKNWLSKCLGKASTVAGSVGDLLENLPPYAKSGIKLFKELIDLFKSKP